MNLPSRRARSATAVATAVATVACLTLVGCASDSDSDSDSDPGGGAATSAAATVAITDNHGEITVPVEPERLVALDNTGIQTLADWGVEPVAVSKTLTRNWPDFGKGDDVLDIGSHREPNLEGIVEADADLIIGGGRFASFYDDIKGLNPTVIEINARDGQDHASELKRQTEILGQVFDKRAEAKQINDAFDRSIADAAAAYNGEDTVVGLLTSGGKISYVAPVEGRSIGVVFPTLKLKPAIEQQAEDTSHGDEISVEAIAAANPDWLIVMDRDAATQAEDGKPARDLIAGAEALKNVTAVQKDQIIYLDATFYADEGIQAYTGLYQAVADAFGNADGS